MPHQNPTLTILADDVSQWYALITCHRQEKNKLRCPGHPSLRRPHHARKTRTNHATKTSSRHPVRCHGHRQRLLGNLSDAPTTHWWALVLVVHDHARSLGSAASGGRPCRGSSSEVGLATGACSGRLFGSVESFPRRLMGLAGLYGCHGSGYLGRSHSRFNVPERLARGGHCERGSGCVVGPIIRAHLERLLLAKAKQSRPCGITLGIDSSPSHHCICRHRSGFIRTSDAWSN